MVRKITAFAFAFVILFCVANGTRANAAEVYDGNFSTTYLQYMKDIVSGIGLNDDYVAFRSGQYEYKLVVGDLEFNNNSFIQVGDCKEYVFSSDNSYNSYYTYEIGSISNFTLNPSNKIIYSNLGEYPQLVTRGDNYEILQTILIAVGLLGFVISGFFSSRKR